MGKGLQTLKRINEWTVEERRRELGERLKELEVLEGTLIDLEEELKNEQHSAANSPEIAGFFYGHYADAVIHRRAELQALIKAKEEDVGIAQGQLGEAYREFKKYEVVYKNQKRQTAKDLIRTEQAELDELGLQAKGLLGRQ